MALKTAWFDKVDKEKPLDFYPRPYLRRKEWTNLNGIWQCQITLGEQETDPLLWKDVVVPYPIGSALSGIDHILEPSETLWYRHTFAYRPTNHPVILHFEAVDQECVVYINGHMVGQHKGGYAPFSFDIGRYLKYQNTIMVKVKDASDSSIFSYGKQRLKHEGIWYTPIAGIWQTVWLEELPMHPITDIKITPDFDEGRVFIELAGHFDGAKITISAKDGSFEHIGLSQDGHYVAPMENFHAWSVDDPFLYDVKVETEDDCIDSYFGMRKFASVKDANGFVRFTLNNQPLFLSGLLDQGYNPDGIYTFSTLEAMVFDIETTKKLGFNMLRKHVKQECRYWYYLCDTMGMLVMQDMPSGGSTFDFWLHQSLPVVFGMRKIRDDHYYGWFGRKSEASKQMYAQELDEMLDSLYNFTCIFAWVPFNEGWGQFDSVAIGEHIADYDTTRLLDLASGWHDQGLGDFNSRHVYFHRFKVPHKDGRMLLLSEFGGYAYVEEGHSQVKKLYGYRHYEDKAKLNAALFELYQRDILANIEKGLAGCIYTQLSDVENECNGLWTYDRAVLKIDGAKMRRMNERIYRKLWKKTIES